VHHQSPDGESELRDFLCAQLPIDCPQIRLVQNGTSNPRRLVGMGSLIVSPSDGVSARLTIRADPDHPHDAMAELQNNENLTPGQFAPDAFYYRLDATDVRGRVWQNDAVHVRLMSSDVDTLVVQIKCDFVETRSPFAGRDHARLIFADDLQLPANRHSKSERMVRGVRGMTMRLDHTGFRIDDTDVTYHRCAADPNGRSYEFTAAWPTGAAACYEFDQRLLEAIHFVTASLALPVWSEVAHAGQFTVRVSKHRPTKAGLVRPPLNRVNDPDAIFALLRAYFEYACRDPVGGACAPATRIIRSIIALDGAWLEAVALQICTAAEGLLNEPQFKMLGAPGEAVVGEIDALRDHLESAPVRDTALVTRARALLAPMKSSSAKDRLHQLASQQVISEAEIAAWNSLRHRAAHGTLRIDDAKLQPSLDSVYAVCAVIYKLTFLLIGYRGKYTNYGVRGWPTHNFCSDLTSHSRIP
jgi:AcrR family transcriptional regulator